MYKIFDLFDMCHTQAAGYLSAYTYPWQALAGLKAFIRGMGNALDKREYSEIAHEVWAHRSATLSPSACILAPCIIGAETEIRQGAFLRGGVLLGKNCVVGNSTEVKNSIFFDSAKAPHFNYVGDSILGFNAHLGAGAITSNVKSDKSFITIKSEAEALQTNLKKVGAFVGDFAEIGCNSVLNPGTGIGKNATVYPLSSVRGFVPQNTIYKNGKTVPKY